MRAKVVSILSPNHRPESDESCIYSTLPFIEEQAKLPFIEEQAKLLNVNTPCVTFDQPLWLKATGIINDANLNIVCRLGGFHTLMSFLGSVGNMMTGSGLEELFAEVYAEHSVIHMMSGKAFSRALCAHFLTESALMTLILTIIKEDENFDRSIINKFFLELYLASTTKQQLDENLNTPEFEKLSQAISDTRKLSKKSRTVKLWISYANYVATIKKFIIAERISNWELYLEAVTEMLNLLAATGDINYAKSARLYIQQMRELQQTDPWLFEKYTEGYHAVRQSDQFLSGLWSDLVIEQILLRSIKTRGGLIRGCGMSESVRHLWVLILNAFASIYQAMTDVSALNVNFSE